MMICKELRDTMWREFMDEAKAFIKKPHQNHNLNIYHLLHNIKMLDEMMDEKEEKETYKSKVKTKDEGMWS